MVKTIIMGSIKWAHQVDINVPRGYEMFERPHHFHYGFKHGENFHWVNFELVLHQFQPSYLVSSEKPQSLGRLLNHYNPLQEAARLSIFPNLAECLRAVPLDEFGVLALISPKKREELLFKEGAAANNRIKWSHKLVRNGVFNRRQVNLVLNLLQALDDRCDVFHW